jgi:hypothetical protein
MNWMEPVSWGTEGGNWGTQQETLVVATHLWTNTWKLNHSKVYSTTTFSPNIAKGNTDVTDVEGRKVDDTYTEL